MSLRCQVGDLAQIIGASPIEGDRYKGQLVEIKRSSERCDCDWVADLVGFVVYRHGVQLRTLHFEDCELRPLRGNPDATTETRDEVSA